MVNFESLLFDLVPWVKEVLIPIKSYNDSNFLRGRTGWVRRGIKNPESIYDHSCKLGLASYYLFNGSKDEVAQGIVHDFAEVIEPDYIPGEICVNEKRRKEKLVMLKLKNILPNGDYWFEMWENYENRQNSGQYISELDKICPAIQAIEYMKIYTENNLEEFYFTSRKKVQTPQLIKLLDDFCLDKNSYSENTYIRYFNELKKINLKF